MNAAAWQGSVAIDGRIVDREHATISVYDRGFIFGDSVFDTTRTYDGVPFRLEAHVERLARSAAKMGFELPLSVADFTAEIRRLVDEARGASGGLELSVRQMVTRGQGPFGLDPEGATEPRRVLFLQPLKAPSPAMYRDGVGVITYATFRPSDAAQGAKVGNYLESVLAVRHAHERGAHEALILCHDGHVIEGTTTNVFAIYGTRLVTPPTTETILPGITRGLVLEVAASAGFTVEERRMVPADFATADEAFITSSIRELLPISSIDGKPIAKGSPWPGVRRLHEAFRAKNGLGGPSPWG
ncbi:MAG: branched-chain-amino acid aminotransferase [Polyangiaceae bacterium]|nr:branched-chain-amino acid aminotransferase [Polyangiaceae bacterium]